MKNKKAIECPADRMKTVLYRIFAALLMIYILLLYVEAFLERQEFYKNKYSETMRKTHIEDIYESRLKHIELHPLYYMFFNKECLGKKGRFWTIHKDGFRGKGPENCPKNRRLAFITGGSAAFGWYSLSDDTSIAGFLNRFQDEYFFVNAACPAWMFHQEFERAVFELIKYKPALIVSYTGFNDAWSECEYKEKFPYIVPHSWDHVMERLGKSFKRESLIMYYCRRLKGAMTFYAILDSIKSLNEAKTEFYPARKSAVIDFDRIPLAVKDNPPRAFAGPETKRIKEAAGFMVNTADAYREICEANGIRFVAVLQAVYPAHNRMSPVRVAAKDLIERYPEFQCSLRQSGRFHDLSNVFDKYPEYDIDDIFYDDVHVTDTGNKIIAGEITALIHGISQQHGIRDGQSFR